MVHHSWWSTTTTNVDSQKMITWNSCLTLRPILLKMFQSSTPQLRLALKRLRRCCQAWTSDGEPAVTMNGVDPTSIAYRLITTNQLKAERKNHSAGNAALNHEPRKPSSSSAWRCNIKHPCRFIDSTSQWWEDDQWVVGDQRTPLLFDGIHQLSGSTVVQLWWSTRPGSQNRDPRSTTSDVVHRFAGHGAPAVAQMQQVNSKFGELGGR